MNEKNNKKKKVLILVLVLGLVLLTIGGTYAFFTYTRQGQQENVLTTGRLYFIYDELSEMPDNSIAIQNAYPVSDETGKLQEEPGMFEFQVRATTSGSAINYEVYLTKDDDTSTLDEKVVNTYLSSVPTKGGNIETEEGITNKWTQKEVNQYNKLWISQEPPVIDAGNGKTLLQDTVPDNQTDYTKTYRYRMWVNENASGTDEEGNWIYGGKTFTVRVNVYASNEELPPPISPPNYLRSWAIYNDYQAWVPVKEEVDFHTSELKQQITSIVFEKSSVAPLSPEQSWDISEDQDESIMAYLVEDTEVNRTSNNSLIIDKNNTLINLGNQTNIKATKIADIPETPKKVIIQSAGEIYANPISAYMFSGNYGKTFAYLQKIEFNNFNTSKVTDMSDMFARCSQLTTLDLSGWSTSNVTDMTGMFSDCRQLSTITGIEKWDTSKVTSMGLMFFNCGIDSLDISNWIIQEETDVTSMFCSCGAFSSEKVTGIEKYSDRKEDMIDLCPGE